jgi:proline iminopeptidase
VPTLYPEAPPLRTLQLPVSEGHVLQVHEFGAAGGIPALVLHGGPGSGCSPLLHRFFDPARYRVICPDQRGAGGSTPRGGTEHNTTDHLLADLRALREHLGLERWLVVGGSWGATLALAHAAAEPAALQALLLRSSFLARAEDIDSFFDGSELPPPAQLALRLQDGSAAEQADTARAWWAWEQRLATGAAAGLPDDLLPAQIQRYRVQGHYLAHGCWLQRPTLLQRCEAVPHVPTLLLHADDDRICPPAGAHALHTRLPHAGLQWVHGAGHDAAHPAMAAATVRALDHYARHGGFGPVP